MRLEWEEMGLFILSFVVWVYVFGVYLVFVWVGRGVFKRRDCGFV